MENKPDTESKPELSPGERGMLEGMRAGMLQAAKDAGMEEEDAMEYINKLLVGT